MARELFRMSEIPQNDWEDAWKCLYKELGIGKHDFSDSPLLIPHREVKDIIEKNGKKFPTVMTKEVRNLGYQISEEDRPNVLKRSDLFILPYRNDTWVFVEGDGYFNFKKVSKNCNNEIENIRTPDQWRLYTYKIGNSEQRNLDLLFHAKIIEKSLKSCGIEEENLVSTIKGRHRVKDPGFEFIVGEYSQKLKLGRMIEDLEKRCDKLRKEKKWSKRVRLPKSDFQGPQYEIDGVFEGDKVIVNIEMKEGMNDYLVRQTYFPFREIEKIAGEKRVVNLFVITDEKDSGCNYNVFIIEWDDKNKDRYNSWKIRDNKCMNFRVNF